MIFNSKSEAVKYFKEMLSRYDDGEEIDSSDDAVLFELLQRHPEVDKKIGVGVNRFYRQKSPNHPTSCFHLERIDGTTTDFSYKDCISENSRTLEQKFYNACRYSVSQELIMKKEKLFSDAGGILTCKKTGIAISIHDAEYRHTIPRFRDIVKDFILKYNITVSPLLFRESSDMQYVVEFADSELEELFKKYHTKKSNLAMFKKYER